MLPVLVCIAPEMAQERHMVRVAQTRLTHTPGLMFFMTTDELLNEYGTRAGIWSKQISLHSHAGQVHGLRRQSLFGMISEKMAT